MTRSDICYPLLCVCLRFDQVSQSRFHGRRDVNPRDSPSESPDIPHGTQTRFRLRSGIPFEWKRGPRASLSWIQGFFLSGIIIIIFLTQSRSCIHLSMQAPLLRCNQNERQERGCAFCLLLRAFSLSLPYHSSPDDTRRTVQVEEPSFPPLLSPLFFVKDWIPCKQKGVTDSLSVSVCSSS